MSARQDFSVDSGRDYGLPVTITEDDDETPMNLLDCDLSFIVCRAAGQAPIITKTSADDTEIDVTSVADGEATIYIDGADTEDFGGLTCEYELSVTDSDGDEATVLRGLITIKKSLAN